MQCFQIYSNFHVLLFLFIYSGEQAEGSMWWSVFVCNLVNSLAVSVEFNLILKHSGLLCSADVNETDESLFLTNSFSDFLRFMQFFFACDKIYVFVMLV